MLRKNAWLLAVGIPLVSACGGSTCQWDPETPHECYETKPREEPELETKPEEQPLAPEPDYVRGQRD